MRERSLGEAREAGLVQESAAGLVRESAAKGRRGGVSRSSFDYAVIRVVPRVELEEFVNAGVIVFCLERRFLEARVRCEAERLRALWPGLDTDEVARQLEAFRRVAAGAAEGGPIARLSLRERFHWLVSPRNTIVQVSAVHTGVAEDPARVVGELLERMVPGR